MQDTLRPDWFAPSADASWCLSVERFDAQLEPSIEAVFALVNGYMGARAALEEGGPAARPATFVAGVFNTPAAPQSDELEQPIPELVVAPDWSRLHICVDGQDLRIDQAELLEQRRVLDLQQGVLLREWRVRDAAQRVTRLRSLRFASLDDRHALVQLLWLLPENYSGTIVLESMLDANVTNANQTRHLALAGTRVSTHSSMTVIAAATGQGEPSGARTQSWWSQSQLQVRTLQSGYDLSLAAQAGVYGAGGAMLAGQAFADDALIGCRWEWQAQQGQPYELHKIVTLYSSRDVPDPQAMAQSRLGILAAQGAPALLAAQRRAWAARWQASGAEISGDLELQREIRFALYHLSGAAHAGDERASVGARALTGERYRGHVFWDTETFVWPFFLFTAPPTARALLMYRYHTLAGARNKARAQGYRGALFAWESTDTGEETTPPFINVPGLGRQAVRTGIEEHHLAADIAYAVEQYHLATGDDAFFRDYGAEMLLDIARFWASRAATGDDGRYHINAVIGPDEYHETVDDNAYTNVMAQWTLRRGLAVADALQLDDPARWSILSGRLALSPDELATWRRVADGLATGLDASSGLFEQFRGYYGLREVDMSGHDAADRTMDVKLGWEELQRTQVLKQADVVMLMVLLWDQFPAAVREANFRFYEPRTAHDSSLSPSFHALMAARLGDLPLAERYLRQAARIDLDFTRRGWAGASGGVHIAALGGIWQALALGFLGMRPAPEGLRIAPHIPPAWGALRMPVVWRGSALRVTARPAETAITVESGPPARLAIDGGEWRTVLAGETLRAQREAP